MDVIYLTRGKAKEFAPLAVSLYTGCAHACLYCYVPSALRRSKEQFHTDIRPRDNILQRLEKDAKTLEGDDREILISFTHDPYQPIEDEKKITRQAIEILIAHSLRFTILTKGGMRAVRDFDLLENYSKCSFGTTLVFINQKLADEWEPNAASTLDRFKAIQEADERNIRIWISLEPVIDPDQAFQLIAFLHRYADHWKIGKLNYFPEIEKKVDWVEFRRKVVELMEAIGASYYLKESLRKL